MPQAVQGAPAVMLCCPSNCLVPGQGVVSRCVSYWLQVPCPLAAPSPQFLGLPGSFLVLLLFSRQRGGVLRSLRSCCHFPVGS